MRDVQQLIQYLGSWDEGEDTAVQPISDKVVEAFWDFYNRLPDENAETVILASSGTGDLEVEFPLNENYSGVVCFVPGEPARWVLRTQHPKKKKGEVWMREEALRTMALIWDEWDRGQG